MKKCLLFGQSNKNEKPRRRNSLRVGFVNTFILSCTLGIGGASAENQNGVFTTFDPPGSMCTFWPSSNSDGVIAGYYGDAEQVSHGFVRSARGDYTTFNQRGAGY